MAKETEEVVGGTTDNSEKVQKQTKARAVEVRDELRNLTNDDLPRGWRQAELISEVHQKHLWQILGHESELQFYEAIGIGRSTWHSRRRYWDEWASIALDKDKITPARLRRLRMQNVKQLLRLDIKRRFDDRWIEKAINMSESNFEAAVDQVVEDVNADENKLDQPEGRTTFKVRCTVSQKQFYQETLQTFAKAQNPPLALDDEANIFQMMCAAWLAGPQTAEDQEEGNVVSILRDVAAGQGAAAAAGD